MKRILLLFLVVMGWSIHLMAQDHVVKFSVKSTAMQLKLVYRMTEAGAQETLSIPGSEPITITQSEAGKLEQTELTLTPKEEDYEVTLTANQLVVLRIASSKAVTGINEVKSSALQKLNMDYTVLSGSPVLDFSQCPNIEEITLNNCDVTDVVLPENPKLKVFQVSLDLTSTKALKTLDLSKCSQLETLGLQSVALDTIDLRACPGLKQLTLSGLSNKVYPKAILGAKELKSLTLVNIRNCGLGYHDLPDLNETQLENFTIKNIYFTYINRSKVCNLTVDLRHLATAQGIAATLQKTEFTWFQKVNNAWVTEPLTSEQVTEKDGVFSFSPSILNEEGKATVRCKLFNPGYPDIEANKKTGLMSSNVTVNAPDTTITLTFTSESPGEDEEGEPIEDLDVILQIGGEVNSMVTIDWGSGPRVYTITSAEPQQVSETIALGGKVRIGGPITLLDASASKVVAVTFPDENKLEVLRMSRNKLTEINLSSLVKLKELAISDNRLERLDISSLPLLEELYCAWNKLTQIDFSANPQLNLITCYNNQLNGLDVSGLPKLEYLTASDNALGTIDLTKNEKLRWLDVGNCGLKELVIPSLSLAKLVASGNLLSSVTLAEEAFPNALYWIDLRNNMFDACTINDLLYDVSTQQRFTEDENDNSIFLEGNPGASTYDAVLLQTGAGEELVEWKIDVKGDGTGCNTARIFGEKRMEHGSAELRVGDKAIEFGSPIAKESNAIVALTPDKGYAVSYVMFNKTALAAAHEQENCYDLVVKHNGLVTYGFTVETGIDNPFSTTITLSRTEGGYLLGNLPANAVYRLFTQDGKAVCQGVVDAGGNLTLSLQSRGVYLLNIGSHSLKLIY